MFTLKLVGERETPVLMEEVALSPQMYGRYKLTKSWQGMDEYAFFKSAHKPSLVRLKRDVDYYISGSELVITKEAVASGRVEAGTVLLVGSQALILDLDKLPPSFDLYYIIQPLDQELYDVTITPKISQEFSNSFAVYAIKPAENEVADSLTLEVLDKPTLFGLRIVRLVDDVDAHGTFELVELEVSYKV